MTQKKSETKKKKIKVLPPPHEYKWSHGALGFFIGAPAVIGAMIALFVTSIPDNMTGYLPLQVVSTLFLFCDISLIGYFFFVWKFRIPDIGCSPFFIKKQSIEVSSNSDTNLNPPLASNSKADSDDFGFL